MGRPLKIAKSAGSYFNNPVGNTYGVVGGAVSTTGEQISTRVCMEVDGVGTITCAVDDETVTGVGTNFTAGLVGATLKNSAGTVIGVVDSVTSATELELVDDAAVAVTSGSFKIFTNEAGFVVRQKGKTKYLVQGATTGIVSTCFTANVANNSLVAGQMNIVGTKQDTTTVFLKTVNNYWAVDFAGEKYVASFNGAALAPAGTIYEIIDVASA
jgi:hypothetical protein